MASYTPPFESIISTITAQIQCRERQIRSLATLLSPTSPSPKNIVLHGLTATGKSSIINSVLEGLDSSLHKPSSKSEEERPRNHAIIRSAECITSRHLLERTVGSVAKSINWQGKVERCEDVVRLVNILEKMLASIQPSPGEDVDDNGEDGEGREGRKQGKFTLVFDGIDKQRDATHTLLPALGRMSEVIPNLTTVFIVTSPRPHFLHTANVIYINFPAYTKPEALSILSSTPPPLDSIVPQPSKDILKAQPTPTQEHLQNLWTRYLAALWDTFASHSSRDLISFRHLSLKLWPKFTLPVKQGKFLATDFQRLFISQRALFRDESILIPSIISKPHAGEVKIGATTKMVTKTPQLPYTSQILLLAAYLCSYIPARNDITIFSKLTTKRKRRGGASLSGTVKGGGARKNKNSLSQRRRIDRKLLGPQAFVLERLLAVFWCVWEEATHSPSLASSGIALPSVGKRKGIKELGGSADILAQVATLSSLRLLVRTGKEELDGGAKYRVNVGWEVVRALGRGVGVELGEWLE